MNRLILRLSLSVVAGVVLLTGAPFAARAQHPYGLELTNRFPVVAGADTLRDAWAGGLNSASYSKIDLNTDGTDDLYVHDQTTQRHLTFIATNGPTGWYWRHEPAYESAFPTDFGMLYTTLRDFDGDGRPDLFAVHGAQFWALYRNVAWPGGVGLRFDLVEDTLRTRDGTWLSTSIYGQQAVEDFDGDGDPDILDFNLGSDFFSLYRNPGTTAAGPRFVQEFTWGNLLRCSGAGSACHSYSFPPTTSCRPVHGARPDYALCAADVDGDGDRDLLLGQQYCRDLGLLVNQGSDATPVFTPSSIQAPYPSGPTPASLVHTPAATYADFTFDGQPDLLVAPWLTGQEAMTVPYSGDQYDTRHAAWLYRRTAPGLAGFQFEQDDFLQHEMIDVGNQSAPTLGDVDGDGDLDLLVGNQGDLTFPVPPATSFLTFRAQLALYRNVGTPQQAVFQLEDVDFAQLSTLDRRAFVPVLTDLDGNGTADLVLRFTADAYAGPPSQWGFILNRAPAGQLAVFPPDSLRLFRLQVPTGTVLANVVQPRGVPTFYDVDGDGDRDLLIGTPAVVAGAAAGAVQVFENRGGALAAAFSYNPALLGVLPGTMGRGLSSPAPAVADLDGDGQPELLTATDDGELRVWPGLLAAPAGPITIGSQSDLVRNSLSGQFGPAGLGSRLVLTTGDLDGDGRAEVLVGTGGGGVRLLRAQPHGLGLAAAATRADRQLHVYPNPAAGTCTVALATDAGSADALLTLSLHDALGCRVWDAPAGGTQGRVPLTGIAPGVYSLTATTAAGRRFTRRLSVLAP